MPENSTKILIIDDEKDLCEILKTKLEKNGFQVSVAFDGLEGYSKVLALKPDCIVLDIRMPKEDGLTFLRKLRAYRHDDPDEESRIRKTPVIVLTGAGEHMKSLFYMEGISCYMEKPYDFDVLKEKITQAAGK